MLRPLEPLLAALDPSKGAMAEALRALSFQQTPRAVATLSLLRGQLLAALHLTAAAHKCGVRSHGHHCLELQLI